jgi:hypothetical protein
MISPEQIGLISFSAFMVAAVLAARMVHAKVAPNWLERFLFSKRRH